MKKSTKRFLDVWLPGMRIVFLVSPPRDTLPFNSIVPVTESAYGHTSPVSMAQDARGGYEQEIIEVLRCTYLARGRSRREENALNKRVSGSCDIV